MHAQVAELREEIKTHVIQKTELMYEIDKLRKTRNAEMGARAGVDVGELAKQHEAEVRELKQSIETMQGEHGQQVGALQHKLKWYVENQELIDKYETDLNAQKAEVNSLTEWVGELEEALTKKVLERLQRRWKQRHEEAQDGDAQRQHDPTARPARPDDLRKIAMLQKTVKTLVVFL